MARKTDPRSDDRRVTKGDLWKMRTMARKRLVDFVRHRLERQLAGLDEIHDHFDPAPLQFFKGVLDEDPFRGATRQFGVGQPHKPFAGPGLDRLGFKKVRNRQEVAQIQVTLPATSFPWRHQLIRIRIIFLRVLQ